MNQVANFYVQSFQTQRFYHRTRYHWMICGVRNADELISWGYASTQEQAETAARQEVTDLSSGLSKGGKVINTFKDFTHRC